MSLDGHLRALFSHLDMWPEDEDDNEDDDEDDEDDDDDNLETLHP